MNCTAGDCASIKDVASRPRARRYCCRVCVDGRWQHSSTDRREALLHDCGVAIRFRGACELVVRESWLGCVWLRFGWRDWQAIAASIRWTL